MKDDFEFEQEPGRDFDLRAKEDPQSKRLRALEALWRALSDKGRIRIGYNPGVAEACEELRRLDRSR